MQVDIIDYATDEVVYSKTFVDSSNFEIPTNNLKLWDVDTPNLYVVSVKAETDEMSKRIGFRTIEICGPDVLLNGKKFFMKGCEWMPVSHPNYGMAEPLEHSIMRLEQ